MTDSTDVILRSAGFKAHRVMSTKPTYLTTVSISFGPFSGLENASEKSVLQCICEASNRLTKNECRLRREVHTTLEIAQTRMQRVLLLSSYAFVPEKLTVRQNSPKNIPERC